MKLPPTLLGFLNAGIAAPAAVAGQQSGELGEIGLGQKARAEPVPPFEGGKMLQVLRFVSIAAVGSCLAGAAMAQTVHCDNLHPSRRALLDPSSDGPAHLDEVFCNASTPYTSQRLDISPDGKMLAHADSNRPNIARVMRLGAKDSEVWSVKLASVGAASRGATLQWDSVAPFLWVGLQERMEPSGWVTAPVRLASLTADGEKTLPTIDPTTGRLDAIRWIRDGIALVQFDTRGEYYRPELPNPNPSLAIIDAHTGKVRSRLGYKTIKDLGLHPAMIHIEGDAAFAVILPNGKARSIFKAHAWIIWTEGEHPRVFPNPYPPGTGLHRGMFAMTPDGKAFLISGLLQASGMICEIWAKSPCPPPTPEEGVWAALHDATTGAVIWQMKDIATQFGSGFPPEISSDGRLALMTLPARVKDPTNLALVSMADGSILQRFKAAENFGFTGDGKALWIERGGVYAIYVLSQER